MRHRVRRARRIAPIVGTDGIVVALDINEDMPRVGRTLSSAPIDWVRGDAINLEFALPPATYCYIFLLPTCCSNAHVFKVISP